MYQRILIPTDGSSYSETAIPHGLQLAKQLGLPVVFLHVLDETISPIITSSSVPVSQQLIDEFEARVQQAGREALERAQALAKAAGVAAESKLVEGSPAPAILGEARKDDLIVMGTHGRNSLAAFVLGSVTMRVLHEAPCPVLAVPSHHSHTS
jgi:nucleotide-binding universal stress UspA family protein